jgi:hypothetical protein
MGMEVVDVPKPVGRDEVMVAKAATVESTMKPSMEPTGPNARIGIRRAPHK